jgi:hypothetical protein
LSQRRSAGWGQRCSTSSTGQWSVVLIAGPLAYIVGDAAASARKARLQAIVDAAFVELVSDDAIDRNFCGREARLLRQHSRLAGRAATAHRRPTGRNARRGALRGAGRGHARAAANAIVWRVARLTEAERDRVLS